MSLNNGGSFIFSFLICFSLTSFSNLTAHLPRLIIYSVIYLYQFVLRHISFVLFLPLQSICCVWFILGNSYCFIFQFTDSLLSPFHSADEPIHCAFCFGYCIFQFCDIYLELSNIFLSLCWHSHYVYPFVSLFGEQGVWRAFVWLLIWIHYQVIYLFVSLRCFSEVLSCSFTQGILHCFFILLDSLC